MTTVEDYIPIIEVQAAAAVKRHSPISVVRMRRWRRELSGFLLRETRPKVRATIEEEMRLLDFAIGGD